MRDLLDVYPEADSPKQLLGHGSGISKGLRVQDRTRRLVGDTEYQMPTTFIGQCHAVFIELVVVELCLRFLELQPLVFERELPPQVDLFRGRGHVENTP
jgi:hypothetical protein